MKTLTRIFFFIFAVAIFYSCEPDELPKSENLSEIESDKIGQTGDQKDKDPEVEI